MEQQNQSETVVEQLANQNQPEEQQQQRPVPVRRSARLNTQPNQQPLLVLLSPSKENKRKHRHNQSKPSVLKRQKLSKSLSPTDQIVLAALPQQQDVNVLRLDQHQNPRKREVNDLQGNHPEPNKKKPRVLKNKALTSLKPVRSQKPKKRGTFSFRGFRGEKEIDSLETTRVRLGIGASATVYQGTWIDNEGVKKQVAVKQYSEEYIENHSADIEREISLIDKFSACEHVVNNVGYIVVEKPVVAKKDVNSKKRKEPVSECIEQPQLLIERANNSLDKIISANPAGSNDTLGNIKILQDIATGVSELHSLNALHLDLKPENILLVGNKHKVADFGALTLINDEKVHGYGTPEYRAPELWRIRNEEVETEIASELPFSEKMDSYSLGVIAWQLFHRDARPWEDLTKEQVGQRVLGGETLEISSDVHPKVGNLIRNCLKLNPHRRASMKAILAELNTIEKSILSPRTLRPRKH